MNIFSKKLKTGFTLIELLVVVSIIGLLAALSITALNTARQRAMVARRLADISQIQKALEMYYSMNDMYPFSDGDGCGGWDVGNKDYQLLNNRINGVVNKVANDVEATGNCNGYNYYKYPAGNAGCDPSKGDFYVLGIRGTGRKYPSSAGWVCPGRNWNNEFEWVVGSFER